MQVTDSSILIASSLAAASVAGVAGILAHIITQPRRIDADKGRFEAVRRDQLREVNEFYRLFEPWIDEIAVGIAERQPEQVERVRSDLIGAGVNAPWLPEEYLAATQIKAIGFAVGATLFGLLFFGAFGTVVLGVVGFFFGSRLSLKSLADRARRRRLSVKRRLAVSIDLLALMMEVGGNFYDSLVVISQDAADHPLGQELARVVADTQSGRSRKEALLTFAHRLDDEDVKDLVFAIVKGEELGTPIASILTNQAVQMRRKRSQWAEKATQEAQVTLVFPAMVIMVGCLILAAAPFVLTGLYETQR